MRQRNGPNKGQKQRGGHHVGGYRQGGGGQGQHGPRGGAGHQHSGLQAAGNHVGSAALHRVNAAGAALEAIVGGLIAQQAADAHVFLDTPGSYYRMGAF